MDSFSYLSVLLSIVVGLAITQVLQGVRALILGRSTAKLYAPSLIWAALILLAATQMWWASFGLRDHAQWSFAIYGLILLQFALFYLASGLALPDLTPAEIDLERDYYRNRGWFFGLLCATAVVSILKDVALEGRLPDPGNLLFHALFLASCGTAMATGNRTYHQWLAPVSLALFGFYIATLFAQL